MGPSDDKLSVITAILKSEKQSNMAQMVKDSSSPGFWKLKGILELLFEKK